MKTVQRALYKVELWVAGLSLALLLGLSLLQIIARNFFETGFSMADPLSRHLVLYIVFFGAVLATSSGRHIKLDLFLQWMKPHQQQLTLRLLNLVSALVCALFAWASTIFWIDELQYINDHERWLIYIAVIMPIGFALLVLHFSMNLFARKTTS